MSGSVCDPPAPADERKGVGVVEGEMTDRMTVEQVAQQLAVSEKAVYKALKERKIPAVRFGHRYIISRQSFKRWMETCGQSNPGVQ
jgi:excisionase family DNA binding protein